MAGCCESRESGPLREARINGRTGLDRRIRRRSAIISRQFLPYHEETSGGPDHDCASCKTYRASSASSGKPRRDREEGNGATRGTRRCENRDSKLLRRQLDAPGHVNTPHNADPLSRRLPTMRSLLRYRVHCRRHICAADAFFLPRAISEPLFHVCLFGICLGPRDLSRFIDPPVLLAFIYRCSASLIETRRLPRRLSGAWSSKISKSSRT